MADNKKGSKAAANKGKNAQEVLKNTKAQEAAEVKEKPQVRIKPDMQENTTGSSFKEDIAELNNKVKEFGEAIGKLQSPDISQEARELIKESLENLNQIVKQATLTGLNDFKAFTDSADWGDLRDTISYIAEHAEELKAALDEFQELRPFIEKEIKKPEYDGATFEDLKTQGTDPITGEVIPGSSFDKAIKAAAAAMGAAELLRINYKSSTELKLLTDKFSNKFFSLVAPPPINTVANGQMQFTNLKYENDKSKKKITLLYDYTFNNEIIKKFNLSPEFDGQSFFVSSIIDNLLDEGNNVVSLTKIWHELGNEGSPNSENLTNLLNIIRLGMSTIVTVNFSDVYEAWGVETNGKKVNELISPVMPVQILNEKFISNGRTANAQINITGHTPFYIVGNPISHVTTWNKDVLRLYKGKRTRRYYNVLQFILCRIAYIGNPNSNCLTDKINYEALFEHNGDKTSRDKQLTLKMLYRLFDEVFKPTGDLIRYEEVTTGKPGVKITCKRRPKLPKKI